MLNLFTTLLGFSLVGLLMGILLIALRRTTPPQVRGVSQMAAASVLLAVAMLLFALRDQVPAWLSYPVGNVTFFVGVACNVVALAYFLGEPVRLVRYGAAIVVAGVLYLLTFYVRDVFAVRVLLFALISVIYLTVKARLLLRVARAERGLGWWLMMASDTTFALINVVRVVAMVRADVATIFWQHPINLVFALGMVAWLVFTTAAFVLLVSERTGQLLHEIAFTDSLTGLMNRRAFLEAWQRAHAIAQRQGRPLALLICDLDHFKRVNDQFGHAAGDAVLRAFAARARANIRTGDCVGRLGGEEFGIALPDTDLDTAREIAERLRAQMADQMIDYGNGSLTVTVSIGVALAGPVAEATYGDADRALYQAKEVRNRVMLAASATAAQTLVMAATDAKSPAHGRAF